MRAFKLSEDTAVLIGGMTPEILGIVGGFVCYYLIAPRYGWRFPQSVSAAAGFGMWLFPIAAFLSYMVFASKRHSWVGAILLIIFPLVYSVVTAIIMYEIARWYEPVRE